ncbi:MAG TPA: hypothetical protein VIQ30_08575 [Pseudonocardia sp.]
MRSAQRLGISLKRFEGWEPREVTSYRYDGRGRLAQAVTVREPEWDEEQQALMLALDLHEALTCSGCGGYLPHTTAPEADDAYKAELPIRCHRCTAIAIGADAYSDTPHAHALRFPTRLQPAKGGPL